MPSLRAIMYLRSLDDHDRAAAYCRRRGYRVVGIVHDPDGERYHDLLDAAFSGQAEVVVALWMGDLPEGRIPRTEFVDDTAEPPVGEVRPLHRRPRRRE